MNDVEAIAKQAAELYQQQRFAEAKKLLLQLIEQGLSSAACYNQLGNICNRLTQFVEAEQHYRQALALQPDHLDAMYNLALSLRGQDRIEDAIAALLAIIEVAPNYVRAHFLLGQILLDEQLPDEADQHFQHIMKLDNSNEEIVKSIVAALLEKEAYQQARDYCERLIELNPQLSEIHYNLGVIAEREQHSDQAMAYYHQVLTIDNDHFSATNNLAVLYLQQRNIDAAKHYFSQALRLKPEDEAIRYTLGAISGERLYKEAPAEYIKKLFNHYADHYENHLQQNLDYRVPELLQQAIAKIAKPEEATWRVLDLGCGTGLCGELVKPWAKHLVGVDLADKMLAIAEQKGIYQTLQAKHIIDYLKNCDESFDLIIAGDIFIYFGDLTEVIEFCSACLISGGYVVFSIELSHNGMFAMQDSGRFTHSKSYIKELATRYHFSLRYFKPAVTRRQDNNSLKGAIAVLQRS
ncbi:MAG: tetratricopeptide repeat protein [Gammaproteobacteria bacterium]|nr:tetratricopeptide repeat protein [Gammaproteobacteria bacterium]